MQEEEQFFQNSQQCHYLKQWGHTIREQWKPTLADGVVD